MLTTNNSNTVDRFEDFLIVVVLCQHVWVNTEGICLIFRLLKGIAAVVVGCFEQILCLL